MSLKKKLGIALVAVFIIIVVSSFFTSQKGIEGNKEITVKIIDETTNTTLYDDVLHSDARTLDALLIEQTQWMAVVKTSSYGSLLDSLMEKAQNMDKGPWWIYSSDNNAVCVAQTMCPAIDQVTLSDKDVFTFAYTSELSF